MKENCQACNENILGKYCYNCGQAAKLKRINSLYISHEIEHVLHLDKGIFFTIKELVIRPGSTVRNFLLVDRSRVVKPIIFIIVTSLLYTIINQFFKIEEQYINSGGLGTSAVASILQWVQNHYGYASIGMGIFIALFLKPLFRKHPYNIYEIVILLCFVMGIGMLIFALFAIIEAILTIKVMSIAGVLSLIYATWAIGNFYGAGKPMNYIKALIAYLLGSLLFYIVLIALGFFIDAVKK